MHMKAQLYNKLKDNDVQCTLCPHNCIIRDGRRGICRVRLNRGGELFAETYQKYSAINFDPIEKKPLYHFHPGKEILSIGSVGCNMNCRWCQNCEISQSGVEEGRELIELTPSKLIQMALQKPGNIGLAFTYNEPSISYESVIEVAHQSKKAGLLNVMVSNGYFGREAQEKFINVIDAFNIDIKAFDENVSIKYTNSRLKPVLDNIRQIVKRGNHLELTYLLVPGVNDDFRKFSEFINWLKDNTGADTVLHLSRYFPRYKMNASATPVFMLEEYLELATKKLYHVYAGNYLSPKHNNTYCPSCSLVIIKRTGYNVNLIGADATGHCNGCNKLIFTA